MPSWNSAILGSFGLAIALGAHGSVPSGLPAVIETSSRATPGSAGSVERAATREASPMGASPMESHPPERLVLRVSSSQARVPVWLRPSVAAIDVDAERLAVLCRAGGGVLENVPLGPFREASLSLRPLSAFEGDALVEVASAVERGKRRIRTDVARRISHPDGTFLFGTVLDSSGVAIEGSSAFLAHSAAGTYGYVESPDGIVLISSGPYGSELPVVSFNLAELPDGAMVPPDWTCHVADAPASKGDVEDGSQAEGGLAGTPECRQVRVAFDTDVEFLQVYGGDQDAAVGYVATLASALNAIYTRDLGVRLSTSYVRFWSGNDPWTSADTLAQLTQFKSVWDSTMIPVQRDLAHLLSARNLGGGVAYLPGLCTTGQQAGSGAGAYGVSANLNGYFPTPLVDNEPQNWDPFVVAHELGHNFGAPHTHAYNPPLDGCGLSPPDCAAAVVDEGTIMSYCHLCAGGLANIRLGLHPSNIATILTRLDAISCNYAGTARAPVAIQDEAVAYAGIPELLDVLGNEIDINCEAIDIQSFPATTLAGASLARISGTETILRDRLQYIAPNPLGATSDSFTYTIVDASGQTTWASVTIELRPLRTPENPAGTTTGLDVSFYALAAPTALPDFEGLTPYLASHATVVDAEATVGVFLDSGRTDAVGAVFEGWLEVPADGAWTLSLESDDGSRLLVGDEVVVSNDGLHGMTERSGTIGLAAGRHAIRIEYFDRDGPAGLILRWAGPSTPRAVVPGSALSNGGSDEPADFDNDGVVGASDLSLLLASWGTANATYDLTGDGLVSAQDLAALLFAWAY
ncbi:MAG: M12 family metallo-peptidase [Planctomycetaceae bacterium]|nr:M12 family metallo-peptidase [Planctomycetaceae bacterium]